MAKTTKWQLLEAKGRFSEVVDEAIRTGPQVITMLSKADLLKLDVATRLELIEELWDSIASDDAAAGQVPVTEDERAMLEERLREHRADPESGQPWAEVRAEILKQR